MAAEIFARYLNMLTDYAFKAVFGQERHKELLIDFVNAVLAGEHRVVDLQYRNSERLGVVAEERKVVFDLLCENDRGEKILVELQQAREFHFKDRSLFYAAHLIQEQGCKGRWDYRLKATYVIAILGFEIEKGEVCVQRVFLYNQTMNRRWSDSLQMVFLEIPKAPRTLADCRDHFERWLYLLGHMHHLSERPAEISGQAFLHLFAACEIGKFPEAERVRYRENLSETERMEEALRYAKMYAAEQGRLEGLAKGHVEGRMEGHAEGCAQGHAEGSRQERVDIVSRMLQKGCDWTFIQEVTGMTETEWARPA